MVTVSIVGAGPAGLMAADLLSAAGYDVSLFDQMPSLARKFLMAGRGGLNLTHSEDFDTFLSRYGTQAENLRPALTYFPPRDLRKFADLLGAETFVGSSGRVFPKAMKASPLLRAWLKRLEQNCVQFMLRHKWVGLEGQSLYFETPNGPKNHTSDIVILAFGGASWPRLGSDGAWPSLLNSKGVEISDFLPSNMGFKAALSPLFFKRFRGQPLKNIGLRIKNHQSRGDIMISQDGLEGGAIYALSAALRNELKLGPQTLLIDLKPDLSLAQIEAKLSATKGKQSQSEYLRKRLSLPPLAQGLLRETNQPLTPALIKSCPLTLTAPQGIERAISSAGGIKFSSLSPDYELKALPNIYAIGEMLDWEAPTGGYLLQACFSQAAFVSHRLMTKYQSL